MTEKLETPSLKGTPEKLHYCETCAGECERIEKLEEAVAEKDREIERLKAEIKVFHETEYWKANARFWQDGAKESPV